MFDAIATLLIQGKSVERCLVWALALVRQRLFKELMQHTQRSVIDGLRKVSVEKSRRGLLAGLLETALHTSSNTGLPMPEKI